MEENNCWKLRMAFAFNLPLLLWLLILLFLFQQQKVGLNINRIEIYPQITQNVKLSNLLTP